MSIREIASVSTASVAAENRVSISCLARDIAVEIALSVHASNRLGVQNPDA
jgi:hypothetical protein